jgi:serine/threonine-protein kinase
VNGEIPPAIGDFPAGAQIASYRIDRLIGRGGMATVYRATDVRLDRQVALKVLIPELARDETFRQRFILESRAGASLDHPHVIPVFEAGDADGVLFIAMRYVAGLDVRALIDREGRLPADRTVSIVSQVASALDAAHEHGLVHRDVKPANMLMAQTQDSGGADYVYLSDFGLSKQSLSSTSLTGTGQFLGTLDYMSPEQISDHTVDGRTDLYALGCATFEMLAGQPPFRREANLAVMWAQVSAQPPSVRQWRPELPAAVDAVLGQALAKSPDERQANCTDFAQALRSACAPRSARAGSGGAGGVGAIGGAGSQAGVAMAGGVTPPVYPATELAFGAVGGAIAGGAAAAAGAGGAGGAAAAAAAGAGGAGGAGGAIACGAGGAGGQDLGPGAGGPRVGGAGIGGAGADATVSRLPDGGQTPAPGGGSQPGGYQGGSGDPAAAGYQAGLASTGPGPAVGGYSPSGQPPGAGPGGSGYGQGAAAGPGYGAVAGGYDQTGPGYGQGAAAGPGYGQGAAGPGYGAAAGGYDQTGPGYGQEAAGGPGYGAAGAGYGQGGPGYGQAGSGAGGYGSGGAGGPGGSGYGAGYATGPSSGGSGYGAGGQQYAPGGTAYPPGSPSGFGSPQPPKRGKALPILIGILVVVILAGVGITILHLRSSTSTQANSHHTKTITVSPTNSPSSTPTTSPSTSVTSTPTVLGPAATVKSYYTAVNNQQYAQAWALNPSAHALSSYSTYKAGFAGTENVALTVTGVSGDIVSVSFIAYQTDGSQKDYSGSYTVQDGKIIASSIEQTN